MGVSNNKRDQLLHDLQGKVIRIPDLKQIFSDWPGVKPYIVNPCRDELTLAVNQRLKHLANIGAVKPACLRSLEGADFAFFTAVWWPYTTLEKAKALAFLVIWLFIWDDEIDEPTGFCSDDLAAAEDYRSRTLQFVQSCLDLDGHHVSIDTVDQDRHPIIESFREIGNVLRESYALDQRDYFYREIARFMRMSRQEQKIRLASQVSDPEEYWQFRMGTSAVYVGLAACELANGSHLPEWVLDLSSMQDIWDETNLIISIVNDLLSLKKEITKGCIDSAVPLVFATGFSIDAAVASVVEQLRASKARFDEAATVLCKETSGDAQLSKEVADFVDVCRTNCTGNLIWSLQTARYGLSGKDVLCREGALIMRLQSTAQQELSGRPWLPLLPLTQNSCTAPSTINITSNFLMLQHC